MEVITSKISPDESSIAALRQIGRTTFYETFASFNSEENITRYMDEQFSVSQLTKELNNPSSAFYFALSGDRPIGYLKVNTGNAQTELKNANSLELERIYVLQEYHGHHVGQLLYNKAIEIALQHKVAYVWLGVWKKNKRAIAFYTKNGFEAFDSHIFKLGDDEQTDIMMKKAISNH